MYSFCMRYVLAVLLVSTTKYNLVCVADVMYERSIPAKAVTSFLKVPWINLNSSWAKEVTTHCKNDVTTLFESANAGEMWALKMLDASSRIPSGILKGNIIDLGEYDQCIEVTGSSNSENIQGQHCMVSISLPSKFVENASEILYIQRLSLINPTVDVDPSLTLSVCLPSTCTVQDVVGLVNASIQSTPEFVEFEVSVARVTCSGVECADDFTMGTILTIYFFVAIASVLLFCTMCDFVVRARSENASPTLKTIAKFSLYTNAIKLLSAERTPGTMPAIHGIRFLSMFLIIIHHRGFLTLMYPLVNLADFYKFRETVLASLNFMLLYTVDTFFIISGFLVTYSFLRKLQSGVKYNVLEYYIHRYIRLTPCVGVLLLFTIFIAPHLGSGPIWQVLLGDVIANCRKNWWANLLFIQNSYNPKEMCIPHTWHLAVEMQFFLISPIILYPLFHQPKLGLAILGVMSIAAFITPAIQVIVNNCSFLFNTTKIRAESITDFYNMYTVPYHRALPYLVGIYLGYDVVNNRRRFTKMQAISNWTLACVFILFCFWNTYYIQPNAIAYDAVSEAVYVSFGRLGWSLAMAWILYACTQGYGGLATWLLSLPVFTPLSQLTYGIYLMHLVIQVGTNAMKRTAEYYTPIAVLYQVWGDLVMCIALSFILNLCIETPAIIMEEVIRAKRPFAVIKRASTTKRKTFSAIIGEYLNLTNGQVGFDSVIEMRLQQLDFWRAVSEVLNTVSKSPRKSPTEWAKTWQEWRKGTNLQTTAKDNTKEAAQFKTRDPTLEKELLIFLVATHYGSDNIKDSDSVEPVKSLISDSARLTKKTT